MLLVVYVDGCGVCVLVVVMAVKVDPCAVVGECCRDGPISLFLFLLLFLLTSSFPLFSR